MTKCIFFDNKIQEIASNNHRLWNLINWVKKQKLLAIEVICYDLKLGSGCNLGKDLSKNEEYDQLVKCKNTEMYLYYIYL